MKKIQTICIVILAIGLISCKTMKVNYYSTSSEKVESITLLSTMIGKIQQPVFPLIDAAAFNSKTNSIADEIMDIQSQNIDKCRNLIAESLSKSFRCPVVYGDSLLSVSGFDEFREKYQSKNGLRIDNDNYPKVLLSTKDVNVFNVDNGNFVRYIDNEEDYKTAISEISKITNSDLVAVSFSTLSVVGAGPFGAYGALRLDTWLFLFGKSGELISDAHAWSKPSNINGKDIEEYKSQLDNLSLILEPMMNKVILDYQIK